MIKAITDRIELNDGHTMPGYGFGVYKAHDKEVLRAVPYALKCGYRYIDTATFYKNEKEVGQGIRNSGVPREEMFIVSKIWPSEFKAPQKTLDQSLHDMGLDYLDGYLLHWPGLDQSLRLKTYEALLKEQQAGKVRVVGVSNFLQEHLEDVYKHFKLWPPINQIEVHPRYQEKQLRDFCLENKIQVISWAPLGRGEALALPPILEIANLVHKTPAQVILRWQIQENLVPIPKSVHDDRIRENADVFDFCLSDHQMETIRGLNLPSGQGRTGKDPNTWPPNE